MEGNYKKLIVWQKADQLAKKVYEGTYDFPKSELFGITSQLRRSALSVPTNIVEGYTRQSKKELKRFLDIALGSLAETEYLIDFSFSLGFWEDRFYHEVLNLKHETGALLWTFLKSIN